VFYFIDFALGIQTFGIAIDRQERKLQLCSDGRARENFDSVSRIESAH
jgi:hypothetical protein